MKTSLLNLLTITTSTCTAAFGNGNNHSQKHVHKSTIMNMKNVDQNQNLADLLDDVILHWRKQNRNNAAADDDDDDDNDQIKNLIEDIGTSFHHNVQNQEMIALSSSTLQDGDIASMLRLELDEAVLRNDEVGDLHVLNKAMQLYYATSSDSGVAYRLLESRFNDMSDSKDGLIHVIDNISGPSHINNNDPVAKTSPLNDQIRNEIEILNSSILCDKQENKLISQNLSMNSVALDQKSSMKIDGIETSAVENNLNTCKPPIDKVNYTLNQNLKSYKNGVSKPYFLDKKKTTNNDLLLDNNSHNTEKPSTTSNTSKRVKYEKSLVKTSSVESFSQGKDKVDVEIHESSDDNIEEEVDVAIVGAGIGGLCAGAILNTLYGKKVGVYESHYLAGGCAHAFDRSVKLGNNKMDFTFDSGPTIVLGCSQPPFNPLRQVMNAVGLGDSVEWIRYDGWGMIENPNTESCLRWKLQVGANNFEEGPLKEFGGPTALEEWKNLKDITKPLVSGAIDIPAMAMRPGKLSVVPLLRYFDSLTGLISQGETVTGAFDPFMNGPLFTITDPWLRDWLDALAFSLSGLPASRTPAAAMAYVLFDMHRDGAALDYPKGGLGAVIDKLVEGVEQGESSKSRVNLRSHVGSINTNESGSRVVGLTLANGKVIKARDGVICNAPIWSLQNLLDKAGLNRLNKAKQQSSNEKDLLSKCNDAEMTRSFLHLHLALDAQNLDLDGLEPHYTVMDKGIRNDPCGELNMIAVSNPCVIDRTLAPDGFIVVHAYGAGNEPYDIWKDLKRDSKEYEELKSKRAEILWRAVESIIPDARERAVVSLVGSPLTHERFLRRPRGTYGAATEDLLKDGSTPINKLILCGDGIFPGIGVPAVAVNGASAANAMVGILDQWRCMDKLKQQNRLT